MSFRPLSGLRIVDLSMFVAVPFATATLGELGADAGDAAEGLGLRGDGARAAADEGGG